MGRGQRGEKRRFLLIRPELQQLRLVPWERMWGEVLTSHFQRNGAGNGVPSTKLAGMFGRGSAVCPQRRDPTGIPRNPVRSKERLPQGSRQEAKPFPAPGPAQATSGRRKNHLEKHWRFWMSLFPFPAPVLCLLPPSFPPSRGLGEELPGRFLHDPFHDSVTLSGIILLPPTAVSSQQPRLLPCCFAAPLPCSEAQERLEKGAKPPLPPHISLFPWEVEKGWVTEGRGALGLCP